MAFIEPVTLKGAHATLEPLAREHEAALGKAAADGELWRLWYTTVAHPDKMADYVTTALDQRTRLDAMPFVVRENATGDVVGCTRYFNVDVANRRLEIGHTWYAKRVQRTGVNTECKLLLLGHAFEKLRCIAVDQRGHGLSDKPETGYGAKDLAADVVALIKALGAGPAFIVGHSLGARNGVEAAVMAPELVRGVVAIDFTPYIEADVLDQDGVLRNHQLMPDGAKRDTVVFSIIDGEWPAVKRHLQFQLER